MVLIDGHMRSQVLETVPVLVLDVNDDEADALIASYDRLTGMAYPDQKLLDELLANLTLPADLKAALGQSKKNDDDKDKDVTDDQAATYPIVPIYDEGYDSVVIFTRTATDFARLSTLLGLEKKVLKMEGKKKQVGLCRVLTYEEFCTRWDSKS